jgi:glycosyltransferase involved in cell wall biosynthesis
MKKICIIPAFNESESILKTVQNIRESAPDFDVIVINDSSKDNTLDICREHNIPVLDLPINLGIGGAVQTGYLYALKNDYDIAVQMDGDGQHDARFLSMMEKTLEDKHADMVIGSRFLERKGFQSSPLRRSGIRYFSWLIRFLTGQEITDPTSGMRMVNRDVIREFAEDYPVDFPEPESLMRVIKEGKKVLEMPVVMKERMRGRSSIRMKGSLYYMIKVTIAILLERMRKQ